MELECCGIAFTGTVQINRRGMPLAIKCLGGQRERRGCREEASRLIVWGRLWPCSGKINAPFPFCPPQALATKWRCGLRGVLKRKPEVVQLYNEKMLGVDKIDQTDHILLFPPQVRQVVEDGNVLDAGGSSFC